MTFTPLLVEPALASKLNAALTAIDLTTAWTAYTPTWSSSGTQPALGNGTILGAYQRKDRLASVYVFLQMGSTTTYGTGGWRLSLPSVVVPARNYQAGSLFMLDNGTAEKGGVVYSLDATKMALVGSAAVVSATSPHTWANTDYLAAALLLEVNA